MCRGLLRWRWGQGHRPGRAGRGLVGPGAVVMLPIFGQDGAQVRLVQDEDQVQELPAQVPIRRSQIAFIRGACTAVRRMVVPVPVP
jgi:hypothetical protein